MYPYILPHFYPRSPCGERLAVLVFELVQPVISIHALLAESDMPEEDMILDEQIISIHALLAESDFSLLCRILFRRYFYPRSPCGERQRVTMDSYLEFIISIHALLAESDSRTLIVKRIETIFLSTLSLRRATGVCIRSRTLIVNFYPRSPCGERLLNPIKTFVILPFLSTLSLRRAT